MYQGTDIWECALVNVPGYWHLRMRVSKCTRVLTYEKAVTRAQARAGGDSLDAHSIIAEARQTADSILRQVLNPKP
jgi:hypothetical protein